MKKTFSFLLALSLMLAFTACSKAKPKTVNFWYHSADPVTDAYFEGKIAELNASQNEYNFVYTSFAFADFQEKFQMAVMTDVMPDVVSLGFSNIATFTAQDTLLPLNDMISRMDNYQYIDENLMANLISLGNGTIYGLPYAYNQEVAWYNTVKFAEMGIKAAPATQKEFLALCEKYADKKNGTYFASLRGVRPYDSLLAWLFTYTDGCGYNGSWFNENGKCILSDARFVEALNVYADIYKKGWVSSDSVNNNYAEIVAEFGSGVSMYIVHNSSSESTHRKNLGEGNFASARVLANAAGHYYASGLQPNVYCIAKNKNPKHNYTGAIKLIDWMISAEIDGGLCEKVGRVPCNTQIVEQDWYKNNVNMMLYADYLTDKNYMQILNPYWLSDFSTMITTDMTADFQAVLLGDMTAKDCCAKWAKQIDEYQAEYLASL
ncbi:extracellular solute-binding protein [Treponema parvum]|uniref:Extracellular solute-binding protein n=1 Tax=Treponema parvum TaxID=138851 RepID=A0A975F143_9SPIR|nr:extracellular solute-binding protein [Treponema parvum]QTQ12710.1 extracellular solute-binding protein [Treponema parvum]QTQ15313.1 extracellular solute-binding protein [Treponema parvum]